MEGSVDVVERVFSQVGTGRGSAMRRRVETVERKVERTPSDAHRVGRDTDELVGSGVDL